MEPGDAEIVVTWRNQPRIRNVLESGPDEELTVEKHLEWFTSTRNDRIDYIVALKDSKRPIGVWSYKNSELASLPRSLEQGRYIGDEDALGKGFAKEASKCWTFFGFDVLRLEAIVSVHRVENKPPQALNLALGFRYDNRLPAKDLVTMIIDVSQFVSNERTFWGDIDVVS